MRARVYTRVHVLGEDAGSRRLPPSAPWEKHTLPDQPASGSAGLADAAWGLLIRLPFSLGLYLCRVKDPWPRCCVWAEWSSLARVSGLCGPVALSRVVARQLVLGPVSLERPEQALC